MAKVGLFAMKLLDNPNGRRRVNAETQRNRDAEVARLRRAGMPFRTIAERLDMSLGAVQKSVQRSERLVDPMVDDGDAGAPTDDEMRAVDITCVADIERLNEVERYRLRHMPGPFGNAERERFRIAQRLETAGASRAGAVEGSSRPTRLPR
jgi:hypothetical protein